MAEASVAPDADRVTRALRAVELACLALGVLLIGVLHVVAPTNGIDPLRLTISQYGRSPLAAEFVTGVILIAVGSAATLVLLVRTGVCRPLSVPSVGMALWVLGMLGVALFPKADWAAGATWVGYLHRSASVIAFLALPIAILALAAREARRRGRLRRDSGFDHRLLTMALVLGSAILLAIVVAGVLIAIAESTGTPWWILFPIGLGERVLVGAELVALGLVVVALRVPGPRPARVA
ncbi:DUF998 domain-containing protein [Microbacterium sp. 4R-513]|uniref:DUF998 domain-containing protein n=1 Tax=Microbacterium sp. 4R-513 TaxID=2567934 RepID=UPI0013E1999A|nr:DUF998 domain-containing protein [Microbacterium sp. 4R-513]QIG38996.1 DUF998 domain-containing protein [Microbacterium sp. 4R-513]